MKYNIEGFNQIALVNMGLNANDTIILRWFVDFYATGKMAEVENQNGIRFKWVKYQAVIEDLPILRINNKQVIARHFNKMVDAGIIEKYVHKVAGTYTCFRLTEKYRGLIEKFNPIDQKVETPIDPKVETKDHSIKLNSSIKNKRKFIPPTIKEVENYVKENNLNIDSNYFYNYFTEGNWIDSKGNKVLNWKQKIITWNNFNKKQNKTESEEERKKRISEKIDRIIGNK